MLKFFISADFEGMPYIVSPEHLGPKRSFYEEARKITTRVVKIVAERAHELGYDEVYIADSHGGMANIYPEELPSYAYLIRGYPRRISMVLGVEGCEAAAFLGYHAKAGTSKATFDHTYSGATVRSLLLNGVEVSEYLLNAYLVGEKGIPVILLAGDEALIEQDVKKHTPWVECVALKRAFGRYSAVSPGLERLEKELREATSRAIEGLRRGEMRALMVGPEVRVEVDFVLTAFAETAELCPSVERVSPTRVAYTAKSVEEAYGIFEFLVLASLGTRYVTQPEG